MLLSPVITQELDGWRVSVVRGERVETYLCDNESAARRFAKFLSEPPVEPPRRRAFHKTAAPTKKPPPSPAVSLLRSVR